MSRGKEEKQSKSLGNLRGDAAEAEEAPPSNLFNLEEMGLTYGFNGPAVDCGNFCCIAPEHITLSISQTSSPRIFRIQVTKQRISSVMQDHLHRWWRRRLEDDYAVSDFA